MSDTTEPKTVPAQISDPYNRKSGRLPEPVARMAYEVYTHLWPDQTFDRLHERGGFGVGEIVAMLYAHNFPKAEWRRRFDEDCRGLVSR